MTRDFQHIQWDEQTADDCRHIIRLAVREDLGRGVDLTTAALVPRESRGAADIIARTAGIAAGMLTGPLVLEEMQLDATWQPQVLDGAVVAPGTKLATLAGSTRDLLTAERTILNLMGRLCGIATLTRRFVDAIAGTNSHIYDTRKTTPGWRRMEKYAVRCGGGRNHRTGLFDAILIKDNHLAQAARTTGNLMSPAEAVERARRFLKDYSPNDGADQIPIEVEVDTLEQFDQVLPVAPDIILLDNMSIDQLREAVQRRDRSGLTVELEASGGINLQTVRAVAETAVDRISVGALTHSAVALDIGLDWSLTP